MSDIDHGTDRGYQQHRNAGEAACDLCQRARAAYIKEYRGRKSDYYEQAKQQQRILNQAKTILANRHRAELLAIRSELEKSAAEQNA